MRVAFKPFPTMQFLLSSMEQIHLQMVSAMLDFPTACVIALNVVLSKASSINALGIICLSSVAHALLVTTLLFAVSVDLPVQIGKKLVSVQGILLQQTVPNKSIRYLLRRL
jgi:hypothetical protein